MPAFTWPESRRCAVSLTYDDAVPVHHEHVAPLLTSRGLAGTFYLCGRPSVTENMEVWRPVAAAGHELGNHSLFHACRRDPPERFGWLEPHYDLCSYTVQRWSDEMRIANCILRQIDGRTERTYGKPCGNTTIGPAGHEVRLDEHLLKLFVAGRGADTREVIDPAAASLGSLPTIGGDRQTFAQLRAEVDRAQATGGWLILTFHGVGAGTHGHFIEAAEHAALVDYLAAGRDCIWTAPVVNVAGHVKAVRAAAV